MGAGNWTGPGRRLRNVRGRCQSYVRKAYGCAGKARAAQILPLELRLAGDRVASFYNAHVLTSDASKRDKTRF